MRWQKVRGPGDMLRAPSDQPLPGIAMPGSEFNWIWYTAIERMAAQAQAKFLAETKRKPGLFHDSYLGQPHPGHSAPWMKRLNQNIVKPPKRRVK